MKEVKVTNDYITRMVNGTNGSMLMMKKISTNNITKERTVTYEVGENKIFVGSEKRRDAFNMTPHDTFDEALAFLNIVLVKKGYPTISQDEYSIFGEC